MCNYLEGLIVEFLIIRGEVMYSKLLIQIPAFIIVLMGHMYAMETKNGFLPFKKCGEGKGLLISPTQTSQTNLKQPFQYMYTDKDYQNLFVRDIISSEKDAIKLILPEEFKIPKQLANGNIFKATISANNDYLALGGQFCERVYMFDNQGNYLKEKSPICQFDGIILFSPNDEYLAAACNIGNGFANIWGMNTLTRYANPFLKVEATSVFL